VNLVRDTTITVVGRLVSNGAAALAALVVATTLGATGAGTFVLVRVIPSITAALLGAGVTTANAYLIGARRHPVQRITETTVAIGLVLGATGWLGWAAASGILQARFYTALPVQLVLVVGLLVPLSILRDYMNSIQQGLQTFKGANVVLVTDDAASLVILLPLLLGIGGLPLIVFAVVCGVAASCLVAVVLLWRQGLRPWPYPHVALASEAIRFGIKSHVGRIADLLNWRLDVMILSALSNVEVVGYYAIATKVAEVLRPLSASLTFVLRPVIAGLPVAEARARGVVLYRRFFAINLGAIVVMAFVGGPVIVHLFGTEFARAVPAFQILLIGLAAQGADGVLNGYNVGIGRPEFNSYTALVALIVTVVGDTLFIPQYGLVAAAAVSSAAYTVKSATLAAIFVVSSGITVPQLIGMKEYGPDIA